jgi:hypothetical protein
MALIITSMVSFIISIFSSGDVSLGSEISGYVLFILSITMITFIIITKYITKLKGQLNLYTIFSALFISGPLILIFAIIGFILYLLIYYKNRITSGHISPDYYMFNLLFKIILFIETWIIVIEVSKSDFQLTGNISSLSVSGLYLISTILSILSIILYVLLKYYQTDGFTNLHIN